jgi:RNA polymerase sigma factor (sigma-70 family)
MELAAALLRKDRKATADFVSLYADAIYAYVRRRLIPRSDLVDDIVQEVFVGAWDNLANFRGESSLRAWLLSIAKHKVEDYYRQRIRQAEVLASVPHILQMRTEPCRSFQVPYRRPRRRPAGLSSHAMGDSRTRPILAAALLAVTASTIMVSWRSSMQMDARLLLEEAVRQLIWP